MASTVAYLLSLNFSKVLYVIQIKIGTSVSNSRLFSTIICLSTLSIQQKPYHHPQSALFTLNRLFNGAKRNSTATLGFQSTIFKWHLRYSK